MTSTVFLVNAEMIEAVLHDSVTAPQHYRLGVVKTPVIYIKSAVHHMTHVFVMQVESGIGAPLAGDSVSKTGFKHIKIPNDYTYKV